MQLACEIGERRIWVLGLDQTRVLNIDSILQMLENIRFLNTENSWKLARSRPLSPMAEAKVLVKRVVADVAGAVRAAG